MEFSERSHPNNEQFIFLTVKVCIILSQCRGDVISLTTIKHMTTHRYGQERSK